MSESLSFVLAGGGTSGHINPALAIADQIRKDHPDAGILFCGTAQGLESDMVPRAGYKLVPIRARGLPNRINRELFRAVGDFMAGRRQCLTLLREVKPQAVIGTGGYVCSPLVAAANHLHIPVLLHEQNAFPGRSNRLMARSSQAVCISFPGSEKYFRTKAPLTLTGNPVRPVFFTLTKAAAREALACPPGQTLIVVMGGSLGARTLNEAVIGLQDQPAWQALLKARPGLRLILSAGKQHAETIAARIGDDGVISVRDYLYDAHLWLAAADLVIARAGAMTCAELAALGRPAVLVPYPFAAGDHQTGNARVLVAAGAALMQNDHDCQAPWLADLLADLLQMPEKLDRMGQAARSLAKPEAAEQICTQLYRIMPHG